MSSNVAWWADVATVVGVALVLLGAIWALLRWIAEPRLRRLISEAIRPLHVRVERLEERADTTESHQATATETIERIGRDFREGMERLAGSLTAMTEKQAKTAEDVAEIRGEIRGVLDTPRRRPRRSE